jgi:hypothetical protein
MSRSLIVLVVVAFACPHVALAQPKDDARAAAAKAYFERGDAHFKAGRFLEARAEFSAGYELSRRPLFLFNMAECSRLNNDTDIARETYERYLLAEPNGAQAGLARQRLAAINAKPAGPQKPDPKTAQPPAPAPAPAPGGPVGPQPKTDPPKGPAITAAPSPQPPLPGAAGPSGPPISQPCEGAGCWGGRKDGRTKRYVGMGLGGVGLVFTFTGIYFWRHAASLGDDVTDACKDGCDWSAVKGTYEDSQSAERKQWVFLGLGVSALAAGGVMYWLGERERRGSSLAVVPTPGGGAVTWSGSW